MENLYIGVDIGSGSARAGLFDKKGNKLAQSTSAILQFRPQENFVEQSSDDIWAQVCHVVNAVIQLANAKPEQIKGIGFDATCSLVALGADDKPVSLSPTGDPQQNIIMWMDHRALAETKEINATNSKVLDFVGGEVSPEMELPKLKWLKRHLPQQYEQVSRFFDLADFLVYRSTGEDIRSTCTKACKWTYLAHEKQWDRSLFMQLGLIDLLDEGKIGQSIAQPGTPAGNLSPIAAKELGLTPNTVVAVGMIDAHAGGVGIIGKQPESTLAIIGGTSSCHMAVSREPIYVKGVWGPYWDAMVPGMWLSEGGQSAAGALIDHVIRNHSFYGELLKVTGEQGCSEYEVLNNEVFRLEQSDPHFMSNFHMLGYYHGNRSPRANPNLKGMICGLTMNAGLSDLAIQYMAAIQSVSYGTRHIIETMNKAGHGIKRIHMCGGGTKNPLWLREHANATGCPIVLSTEDEAVILGSAMLAATASGEYTKLTDAMAAMSSEGRVIQPQPETRSFHEAKYQVFHAMYEDQLRYDAIMNDLNVL
ncbi:sugar kinase [Photobacterium rosenbergii]|uniref:Sugar kinase n=1 Tax=Photobacterium rosenbergii TaxID=294936 RepID=A0A2T3N9P1_9GAMM|nr:FGGY-family carbohydrate kinase [Photobacterium rosenbergii]PSW10252.1 sugar kinase [Photobacterium rosenbergii]